MGHPTNIYMPVSTQEPQGGVFNSPRQKTWIVWTLQKAIGTYDTESHWEQMITHSLRKAIDFSKLKLDAGYPISNIIVSEIVPIDTTIVPKNW